MATDQKPSPSVDQNAEDAPSSNVGSGTETEEEANPSLLKSLGSLVLGAAIWAWVGLLYFTGGDCSVEGLEIECVSGRLVTTINLPVAVVAMFFGLIAMVGGVAGIIAAVSEFGGTRSES